MNLSKQYKKILTDEIDLVIEKIDSSESPEEALYYFSAIAGVAQRIFNFEFHKELVHLWVILNQLHLGLTQKFMQPPQKFDKSSPKQFERLVELSKELREKIKKDEELHEVIQEFAVLLYSTNGNGQYLFQKEILQL